MIKEATCSKCDALFTYESVRGGKPRQYCSDECRRYRRRRDKPEQVFCGCGAVATYRTARQCSPCYQKANYASNKEQRKAQNAQWKKDNLDKVLGSCATRRATKRNATPYPLPTYFYSKVINFYGQCGKCSTDKNLTLDHVLALANGGEHAWANFGVLCGSCNSSKNSRKEQDYRPYPRLVDHITT